MFLAYYATNKAPKWGLCRGEVGGVESGFGYDISSEEKITS